MLKGICRVFLAIWATAITILEAVNIMLTPFSQVAFYNFTWGQIISLVFVISFLVYIIQAETRGLREKRANIKIRPIITLENLYVEVLNIGHEAIFSANIEFKSGHKNILGVPHVVCWESGVENAEIKTGERRLAHICKRKSYYLALPVVRGADNKEKEMTISVWPLDKWNTPRKDEAPDDIFFELSFSLNRKIKKVFDRLVFKIHQEKPGDIEFTYTYSIISKYKIGPDGYIY